MLFFPDPSLFHAIYKISIMPVLQLTIFISIILAVIFIVCFVMEAWRNKNQGVEQTSLLPLADDDADISKMKSETDKSPEEKPQD
jgi:hypothetical protein